MPPNRDHVISIHAPLTGSDALGEFGIIQSLNFNPRSPHRERLVGTTQVYGRLAFQSTLPSQGATEDDVLEKYAIIFQSTLPSQGATITCIKKITTQTFQSTLPSQGATRRLRGQKGCRDISIHAPLTGSERKKPRQSLKTKYFNPRSPHRERRYSGRKYRTRWHFNPRSPHRERRGRRTVAGGRPSDFNPRSPHRERRREGERNHTPQYISIHAPLTGSDPVPISSGNGCVRFQSTLPSQGATWADQSQHRHSRNFNPRSPHRERQLWTNK